MRICLALAVLTSRFLIASPAAAQSAADVTGTWAVTWDAGIRTDGDRIIEVVRRATGRLVLTARNDSLAGTWQGTPDVAPNPVIGWMQDGLLVLETAPREITDGGVTYVLRVHLEGRLAGDRLAGTLSLRLREGDDDPVPARRWEATRTR